MSAHTAWCGGRGGHEDKLRLEGRYSRAVGPSAHRIQTLKGMPAKIRPEPYLPNGNPAPGPKFDYKLHWFEP